MLSYGSGLTRSDAGVRNVIYGGDIPPGSREMRHRVLYAQKMRKKPGFVHIYNNMIMAGFPPRFEIKEKKP